MRVLIKLLFPFYRPYWKLFLGGVLSVAAVNALALFPGWTTGKVIDLLVQVSRASELGVVLLPVAGYLGVLWGMGLLRAFLMVAMRLTLVVVSRRVERDQRAYMAEQLLSWDLSTLQKHPIGELMTYFTEDLNRLRNFTGPVILYGLQVLFLLLFTGTMMIMTHAKLAFFSLAPLLLLGPLSYVLRKKALERGHLQQAAFAHLSAFLQQVYPYLRPLRAIAKPTALAAEWEKRTNRHTQASLAVASIEGYVQPLTTLLVGVSLTIVIIYGGLSVMAGEITLGTVGAFSLYVLQLMFPLGALGWLISLIQQARTSAERILTLTSIQPQLVYPRISTAQPKHAGWSWENLGFFHEPEKWIFRGLWGEIPSGAKVVLSMPMGAGKTTFARLLARQIDPAEGQIYFGGVPLQALSRSDLRKVIAYVPQQPVLFSGTIIENLRLVKPEASFAEIWQVLEWAGLAEEIQALPKGLQTDIGIWGQQVSGGQRQRLALAMALLKQPKALILDETFAPLDGEKIREILTYLRRHFSEATWLILTHRQEVRPYVDDWLTDFYALSPRGSEMGAR
ncbi:MAG: ABC transporter ATP-binding protein/permease [Bacteroidia bacterium]|nr:ABC transporter ATP-binding protein/permease [Bacteroidia bacterium]MCX7764737.1 ABC transporter ATP-binding protein/permease [Bacteroidia bacterium]MDW8057324.1 ABC transporter ATP-binding protein [Bacteroidia bacterium]